MPVQVPVLIVGGSLNGLTGALCLAHHGIKSLVVERHSSTTVQYKFRGVSPRSMEIVQTSPFGAWTAALVLLLKFRHDRFLRRSGDHGTAHSSRDC